MTYRGMDRAALDAAYDNTAAVGMERRNAYHADWSARSDRLRASREARLDIAYGDGARQRLDLFPCGTPGAPTLVYIHGGYWQMGDKEPYVFVGESLLEAGFHVVHVEYTIAPAARMGDIVGEVLAAVDWVIGHAAENGGDPGRVFVSGHSAGGHLTAMAMTDSRLAGGVSISGLFDLEPIRLCYLNEKLGLDAEEATRYSPLLHLEDVPGPLVAAVGLDELPELIRQSEDYAAARENAGLPGRYLPLPGREHFSVLEELARPDGALLAALRDLAFD